MFQAAKNLSTHKTYLRFGIFCYFFADFCVYLGIKCFSACSERISKIDENGKFERLEVVLKLQFEVKLEDVH